MVIVRFKATSFLVIVAMSFSRTILMAAFFMAVRENNTGISHHAHFQTISSGKSKGFVHVYWYRFVDHLTILTGMNVAFLLTVSPPYTQL